MNQTLEHRTRPQLEVHWAEQIPEEEWAVYEQVIDAATARGVPFLLAGAFALAPYTGRWRNTKDLDLIVEPDNREAVVALLSELGFVDYYDELPYERHWIYRAVRDGVIVDVIWRMANRRAYVDPSWYEDAPTVRIRGRDLRILPPEVLIWMKLYVLQRDRCDWPDLFNVFYGVGPSLNWERLLERVGEDVPLLGAAVSAFAWLCPQRAAEFPTWIWPQLELIGPLPGPSCAEEPRRVDLLDTRDWFGPTPMPGERLAA